MSTVEHSSDMLREYQSFAERVQALLRSDTQWRTTYAGYAAELLKKKDEMAEKRGALGGQSKLDPLYCYTSIGAIKGDRGFDFDLRYLGQSVGTITVKNGTPLLTVDAKKAADSQEFFGYDVGKISGEDWNTGAQARAFKAYYKSLTDQADMFPRQKEHMVESALFTELGKEQGDAKALKGIQPITCVDGVRLHMKTALFASRSIREDPTLSKDGGGGEIDVFCRRRSGNRSRLTVIEVKDENKKSETFHLAIKQAIAYAVFVRELARSQSGRDWMDLWGLGNQPWENGFTINAVAAMPKGATSQFPFAGMKLELTGENPGDATDRIELHYIAFLGEARPRDGQDVQFETSL